MSLEKLSEVSGVPLHPLVLFEEDRFLNDVSEAYALAYLRKIAQYLEISGESIRSLYFEARSNTTHHTKEDDHRGVEKKERLLFFSRDVGLTLLVLGIVFWLLGYQAYNYFRLPSLVILSPEDNAIRMEREIEIRGKTEQGVLVKINNEAVQIDRNEFQYRYFLTPGVNILDIVAERRFGKKLHIRRIVMYNP
ncbi:MAG: hypothetical protein HZA35_00660 [Parcubacteria group bacterium]|nr:hypothetical protein [Parcubacteria group bacterium]